MSQEKITREKRKQLKKRLNAIVKPKMKYMYLSAGLSWVQFLLRLVAFGLLADMFYALYRNQPVDMLRLFMLLMGCTLVGFIVSQWAKSFQGLPSQFARDQIKSAFFDAFKKKQGELDSSFSTADVLLVASYGIDSLDTYYQQYLGIILRTYLNCATILVIVGSFYPIGAAIFIASIPFIPLSIVLMQKRSQKIMQHYWATYMDVGNLFMDDLQGMNTLYSYQADERYEQTFRQKAEAFRQSTMTLLRFQLQAVGYMDAIMYMGVGISGFYALHALSLGTLNLFHVIFFILIATEFFAPIRELGYSMHLLMMNTKMADKIFTFLDDCNEMVSANVVSKTIDGAIQTIQWQDVTFQYDKAPVIQQLTMTNVKGELFAIAGESGAGKTTLARLLLRRETGYQGTITLDEHDLMGIDNGDLYTHIMSVSLDSYLFQGTILSNLQMATAMSQKDIIEWLHTNQLLTFVEHLPDKFETQVGENGVLLSTGQRQQIICCRALLANRDIYIIDEMTSSIDRDNEGIIFEMIRLMSREHIVLFISHKMRQVQQADRVLFLESSRGTIGTPKELYAQHTGYRQLVDTQAELEAILDEH